MEEKTGRWQKWRENLKHTYRLVIMNDETFEEVGSYKLNMLNLYLLLSTILVVVAVLIFLLIAYTPLKRYLPGYIGNANNKQTEALLQEIDSLSTVMADWELYFGAAKNRALERTDDSFDADSAQQALAMEDSTLQLSEVDPSEIDQQLRQEIEFQEIGEIMQSGPSRNPFENRTRLEQLFFVAPVTGEISAHYMPQNGHLGVDILAPRNTAVKSALDGYVVVSDWTLETGNTIGIQHGNNIVTFYKHNSALLKEVGTFVKAGEAIAIIGNTGTLSDGPHLHFELWYNGQPVNPVDYISF